MSGPKLVRIVQKELLDHQTGQTSRYKVVERVVHDSDVVRVGDRFHVRHDVTTYVLINVNCLRSLRRIEGQVIQVDPSWLLRILCAEMNSITATSPLASVTK